MDEYTAVSEDIKVLSAGLAHPLCGAEAPMEVRGWFGESGSHLRSFDLTPLKDNGVEGLLVLASEDPQRFYQEMGTLYLNWLGELAAATASRLQ